MSERLQAVADHREAAIRIAVDCGGIGFRPAFVICGAQGRAQQRVLVCIDVGIAPVEYLVDGVVLHC